MRTYMMSFSSLKLKVPGAASELDTWDSDSDEEILWDPLDPGLDLNNLKDRQHEILLDDNILTRTYMSNTSLLLRGKSDTLTGDLISIDLGISDISERFGFMKSSIWNAKKFRQTLEFLKRLEI